MRKIYSTADGRSVHALEDASFTIDEGEFIAVVGPSGCGKSTLLKILGGLLVKTEGDVILRGEPVNGPRRDIGVVFQDPVLLPWLTVLKNVLVPVRVQNLNRKVYRQRALELLDLVGLQGFQSRYPHELSGGMQQRVSISRALIHDPTVLLMDEPFGALDAMTREHMNLELQRIWLESGKTALFITHSITEAVFLADRVLVMSPRPACILRDITIALERPRSLEVMGAERFGAFTNQIRHLLESRGGLD